MRGEPTATSEKSYEGLLPRQLVDYYRLMLLSRRIDDREIQLKRQQKIYFQVSCAGHEALLVAAGKNLRPGYDWVFPYYRDRALCLALGLSTQAMFLQAVGAAADPSSGGRQMPSHWASRELHIFTGSSPTGSQLLQAIGCAEAGRYYQRHPEAAASVTGDYREFKDVEHHADEVTLVTTGDGTTSQGEFWESLNTASMAKVPVVYLVEDNGYAISTPVQYQTPGGSISRLLANFPHFYIEECDGTDLLASYATIRRAVEYVRSGHGPALVHGHCTRPYSHSLSDEERLYRPESEIQDEIARDPITRLQKFLLAEGICDNAAISAIHRDVDAEVRAASDAALEAALPDRSSYALHVYSDALRPTDPSFDSEQQKPISVESIPAEPIAKQESSAEEAGSGEDTRHADGAPEAERRKDELIQHNRTMAELINHCLRDEMRRDERILIFGEDVADFSNEECLQDKALKGKGGVFKITIGLQRQFGSDRVFNSPLAEANIVGRALGMAVRGLKPVVEIQFFDYIWPAMHQLRNELPLIRWRSNNVFSAPVVIRAAIGGYLTGGAIYHSQCGESMFTHTPGMHVVFPSNALDAAGLLRTAIRCDDPVLFLEHKRLYREPFGRAPYPGPDYAIPFGKARVWREGTDATVVTYGATLPRTLQAAQRLEREQGISIEVLDLRTLNPYDFEAIANSVRKTSRVLVVHEDMLSWGYGAEIAARIASELFSDLDAPVERLAAKDTFVAYQPLLEAAILPQAEDIFAGLMKLCAY
jgi:2-oxoisovalerate dehydrogenase E1 component